MVQNASGIVMLEALRHVGLPTIGWHRAAREGDGLRVERLHALAWHQYRCTHKTKSQLISIWFLLSIYGTHPELRPWLRASQSGVMVRSPPHPALVSRRRKIVTQLSMRADGRFAQF